MSYIPQLSTPMSYDASNRLRVGQLTTLFDGKTLNVDDPLLWETVGTGTSTFQLNKISLAVTSGQYLIRKSKRYFPYFSGKSQQEELTFDNGHTQANVVKRAGYFSSVATGVYDTAYDGFWLEDDGTTKRLKGARAGVETMNVPMASWDNYSAIQNYDWSKFTVCVFDFLWLGGAILRFFVRTPAGLTLIHTFHYPGTSEDTFNQSPNHPVRYEIRSTTGAGTFRPICSQVSTEGSINESGKHRTVNTGQVGYTMAAATLTYPLLGLRLNAAQRDKTVKVIGLQALTNSTNDQMLISLVLNPTITVNTDVITWTNVANSAAVKGVVSTGAAIDATVSGGTEITSFLLSQNNVLPPNILLEDFLTNLGMSIANVSDELWLCVSPITTAVTAFGVINYKEY